MARRSASKETAQSTGGGRGRTAGSAARPTGPKKKTAGTKQAGTKRGASESTGSPAGNTKPAQAKKKAAGRAGSGRAGSATPAAKKRSTNSSAKAGSTAAVTKRAAGKTAGSRKTASAPTKAEAAKKESRSTSRKSGGRTRSAAGKTAAPPRVAKPAPAATSQDPIQYPEEKPLPKTYLTRKELREFRDLLLEKRAELTGDMRRLSDEALSNEGTGAPEHPSMPIHMADVGSDNWEQEFTLGLLANERSLVREIDDAIDRIDKRVYGICVATRTKISKARLRAKPWARYCIEHARAREEGRA